MPDKEALFVVIGVDEPAGDTLSAIAADLTGVWMKHVHTVHLHHNLAVVCIQDVDIRFAEDDKQVTLAGVLQVIGHVQVGVHTRLEYGNAAQLIKLR